MFGDVGENVEVCWEQLNLGSVLTGFFLREGGPSVLRSRPYGSKQS